MVNARGLEARIEIDSCGTAGWHVGESPDARTVAAAASRGYDLSQLRGRQVSAADFEQFNYILAMDRENLANLERLCPTHFAGHLGLFLPFARGADASEVPDPYYGGDDGFDHVLDLIEAASEGLLDELAGA